MGRPIALFRRAEQRIMCLPLRHERSAMARKKYIRDYRLVERVDERGRLRTDYEYIGGRYVYHLDGKTVQREKKRVLIALGAAWLFFAAGLVPNAAGMRAIYVAIPYLFAAIPMGLATDALLTAARTEPLRHQQADVLENRYPPAALFAAILPAISLAGEGVRLLLGAERNAGDLFFALCAAAVTAGGAYAFSRRERFLCREEKD